MIPSRSRLQSWNPDSLATSAESIHAAGRSLYGSIRRLDDEINRLDETKGWRGRAHDAATGMFRRATDRASRFLDYAAAVARALNRGSDSIGRAQNEVLRFADEVDRGELRVTDQWVVLIKAGEMSAEKAAALEKEAEAAQEELNRLVGAVDAADAATRQKLLEARINEGAGIQTDLDLGSVPPVPRDDVPDPATDEGQQFQELARAQDMATSVRDKTVTEDDLKNRITTLTMLDGSKHVITEYSGYGSYLERTPKGTVKAEHTDKNGERVSTTLTHPPRDDGTQTTETWWADGTHLIASVLPDGRCEGTLTRPGAQPHPLPAAFFDGPVPDIAGGALSALDVQAERGIPGLSSKSLNTIETGAKFGGPVLGFASMVYNMASAETLHEACVAAWKGTAEAAGSVGGAAAAVTIVPALGPIAAGFGAVGGSLVFGHVGEIIGNVVCPK